MFLGRDASSEEKKKERDTLALKTLKAVQAVQTFFEEERVQQVLASTPFQVAAAAGVMLWVFLSS